MSMPVIDEKLLLSFGASEVLKNSQDIIFKENSSPQYYYQIITGNVKLVHFTSDAKEFVHGFPFDGHCFGETYLLTDKMYPFSAVADSECRFLKLPKENYLALLDEHSEVLKKVYQYSAERMHFRYIISSLLIIPEPKKRLIKLLDYLKQYFNQPDRFSFDVPFKRSQLAMLVGLRVETVIRTLKTMEKEEIVKIKNGKILY